MIRRINRRKYRVFATDFETHNDEESIAKQETGLWLACLLDETSKFGDENTMFYDMDSYLDYLETLVNTKRKKKKGVNEPRTPKNICIYDFNLSFEWSFILPYLLKRGFKHKEVIEEDDEYVFNSVSTKSVSSVWLINIKFGKKSGRLMFRDLNKMFTGSLKSVAKSFGLETQKGEIDYRKNRLHNYIVTEEEKQYCFNDVRIIVEMLIQMNNRDDKDFWNSVSMASYSMKKLLKSSFPRKTKPYKEFRTIYPELEQEETDFLRQSVGGGITYAPKLWQYIDINKPILHIDAHQMHPTQMYSKPFPYGTGEYFKGKPTKIFKHINCCRIRITYDDVRLHSIIQLIGVDMITDRELVVWDFEIPTMYKCYVNLKIEYLDGYCYKAKYAPFRRYVKDNYLARLEAKKNKDPFLTLYYKLLNNSSYGKFLEKPHNESFKNTINALGVIDSIVELKPLDEICVNARYTYLPVGSCIPAYSRVQLIETAFKFGWEKICYFDTDSIFVLLDEETERVWNSLNQDDFLGGWGLEEICDKAQFTAPKRYKLEVKGEATIKAGGINFTQYKTEKVDNYILENGLEIDSDTRREMIENYSIPYGEVNIVSSSWEVQRAYRVKGGTLIEFQTKEISIPDKYIDIYNKNKLK